MKRSLMSAEQRAHASAYNKEYKKKNATRIREQEKKRNAHRDRAKERKIFKERHPDAQKQYARKWYEKNKALIKERRVKGRVANPEQNARANERQRARYWANLSSERKRARLNQQRRYWVNVSSERERARLSGLVNALTVSDSYVKRLIRAHLRYYGFNVALLHLPTDLVARKREQLLLHRLLSKARLSITKKEKDDSEDVTIINALIGELRKATANANVDR